MTNYFFKCDDQNENNILMDGIWNAIKNWKGYAEKKVFLCRWKDEKGFNTALSIEDSVKSDVAFKFTNSDDFENSYNLIIGNDDSNTITISRRIELKVTYEDEKIKRE